MDGCIDDYVTLVKKRKEKKRGSRKNGGKDRQSKRKAL